jgi:hypothetical protein
LIGGANVLGRCVRSFIILLAFLVPLEIISLSQSPAFGPCLIKPQQEAASAQNNQQQACPTFSEGTLILLGRADKFFEHHDKSILAVFTIALAVSTALLWWSTDKLWRAGERQLKIAEAAAIAAEQNIVDLQRALIVPVQFSCVTVIHGGPDGPIRGYRVVPMLVNVGSTIAKRFVSIANYVLWDGPLPNDFAYPDGAAPEESSAVIAPKVPNPIPIDILLEDIIAIRDKQKRGFIYGWVEYSDIFTATGLRRTEFCIEIEIVGNVMIQQPPNNPPLGFKTVGRYNAIDEDCVYKPGQRPPIGGLPPQRGVRFA